MTDDNDASGKTFAKSLRNREDVSSNFFAQFGWNPDEGLQMLAFDREVRRRFRKAMEASGDGVRLLSDAAVDSLSLASELLDGGLVGAVDGTNALSKIDYMNTTKYACAVGWITSRKRGSPSIVVTKTTTEYADPEALENISENSIEDLAGILDAARDNQSWPTTFREYIEREVALDKCEADCVFIDGPIFTQNLMTQQHGRDLYDRMLASNKRFFGFIKNISGSNTTTRWSAASLRPGEMFVTGSINEPVLLRVKEKMPDLAEWVGGDRVSPYLRVVFRPAQKAFALECHRDDLSLACALLLKDASKTKNHELPMLLEVVDSQLRAGFNGSEAREINLSRMITQSRDGDYMQDYRDQLDVSDEREWR